MKDNAVEATAEVVSESVTDTLDRDQRLYKHAKKRN